MKDKSELKYVLIFQLNSTFFHLFFQHKFAMHILNISYHCIHSFSVFDICFWSHLYIHFDFVGFMETSTCASPFKLPARAAATVKIARQKFSCYTGEGAGVFLSLSVCVYAFIFFCICFCFGCILQTFDLCRQLSVRRQMKQQDDNLRSQTSTVPAPLPPSPAHRSALREGTASELCALAFMNV